jgi:NAD(P)-dependent dehydrogenase (short-subunit alcohol dehydrogenase family)
MESTGKIALITGSGRGLGKNMALTLAAKGTDIVVLYRNSKDEAAEVVAEIETLGRQAVTLQLDTSKVPTFDAFFSELSTILKAKWNRSTFDFLINNAGIGIHKPFAETTEEMFDELMGIHLKGVFFFTQKALPFIENGGRIINLSTGLARFSNPGYAAYATMKGGIEVLTRYLAKELGPRGITANVIAPGIIHTDFTKSAFEHIPDLENTMNSITALGRVGQPDDIGGAVSLLCTPEAGWINGQRIEVSGGMNL